MTTALEGGECSAARPGRTLPPGKTRYPLYRRLGGPQGWSGWTENLAPHRDSILGPSIPQSVAIPTELPDPQIESKVAFNMYVRNYLQEVQLAYVLRMLC